MKDNNKATSDFAHIRGKQVVAAVRGADYAHPGEEKLIDLVLKKIPKDLNRSILDVGCGLGGSAFYMQKNGWGNVTGIDIDTIAIPYAHKTYPTCNFHLCNVLEAAKILKNHSFNLITIFSAFYAFSSQVSALSELSKLPEKNKLLAIYEYTDLTNGNSPYINVSPHYASCIPINVSSFPEMLKSSGWELIDYINLDNITQKWYAELITKFDEKRYSLLKIFPESIYQKGYLNYVDIYNAFKEKILGAGIFYAKTLNQ